VALSISAGTSIPNDFNVIIEIAAGGGPVKYEMNKEYGVIMVDRFMPVAMYYPCNYGFVPSTLAEDGDPMDVLVLTPAPIQPGALVRVRPIGLLLMTDENGNDCKILGVPIAKACLEYAYIESLEDVPKPFLDKIKHFFENYKTLEPNKWVKVDGWDGKKAAEKALIDSVERYKK
jgi:inorganic pyrophosphatase